MTRSEIKKELLGMLNELMEDWDYDGELNEDTGIFRELGLESVDAVALGTEIEENFGQELPFAEFLSKAREDDWEDISIGQFLDFLVANLRRPDEEQVA